jgi:GTP cyclohydrolase IV
MDIRDAQASGPTVGVSLSRVGVANVEKVVRIGPRGAERLYHAKLDCFVDHRPERNGTRMSRFDEVVNAVIREVVLGLSAFKAEQIAQRIAVKVRERRNAGRLRERLAADGFGDDQIAGILEAVPVATHNQRGLGTLHLGLPAECDTVVDATELLAIVENSMSSEIYELMKAPTRARWSRRPTGRARSAEDCVREAIRGALEHFGDLGDDTFVSARQENLEAIHEHSVIARALRAVRRAARPRCRAPYADARVA